MAFYNDYKKYGENIVAIQNDGKMISYLELSEISERMKKWLQQRKLVFAFCENSIGSLCGYIAFLENNVVPVLLDKHIDGDLRERLLEIYQPDYVYIPRELEEEFSCYDLLWSEKDYQLLKTNYHRKTGLYEQLGLLLTTSGSTGSPKLVRQSYDNIQSNAQSIAEYLMLDSFERPITTLPMNYTYGLSIINSHLLVGATLLLTDHALLQREFWSFFKEQNATSFGGVPYTYEMLKKLRFFRMELPSLKYMTQAGGKLAPELHREFAEYAQKEQKKFIVMYGQTEATARMAYLPAEKTLEKYGSMGIAIPGGRLELIDINGNIITETETVGEMVYYGANVTLGYAELAEDLEKTDERHGRLETGDMARRDGDGFYYVVGRKKRFLKIFGNRVNLDETERLVKEFLRGQINSEDLDENVLADCACAGKDDKMIVFVTNYNGELQEKIRQFLSEKTGLHSSAFRVMEIEEIPKNDAGKTLYTKLEKYYESV